MLPTKTAVAYVRVSTERQAGEEKTSLADQRKAIEQLATRLGVVVSDWFTDPGASGATAEKRPGFMALLAHCGAHRADGFVLVLNDSRFGRFEDPEESAYWRHHLRRRGWVVRFAEGDETEDRTARSVLRAIGAAQATEYRENIRRNAKRGARSTVEAGYWRTRAPFGYRRVVAFPPGAARVLEHGQFKAANEKVKLTPHEEEARIVRWIFETYVAGGESLYSLVTSLERMWPTRRWSRTCVAALLKNDAYRGAIVGGRKGDGELYGTEDAHEPLVSPELWQAAQRRLEANRERGSGVRNTHYLLSGLLRCVHCGEAYTGGGGGRSRNQHPEREHRRFYRDNGGIAGTCPGRIGTVMRHLVDDALAEILVSTVSRAGIRRKIERAVDDALSRGPAGDTEATLRVAERKQEARRARLAAAVADGVLLPAEAAPELDRIRAVLADLESRRHALRFASRRQQGARAARNRLLEAITDFPRQFAASTGPERRELLEGWLGRATFDKVSRGLTVGIRTLPALPFLAPSPWPETGAQNQEGLIVRSTSLLQPGHEYRVAEAEEAMWGTG